MADGGGIKIDGLQIRYLGPDYLLTGQKAAVLNSRQSKFPVGADQWIISTQAAVDHIKKQSQTIVTSIGQHTWELTLALASTNDIPVIVYAPTEGDDPHAVAGHILSQFDLDPEQSGFMMYRTSSRADSNQKRPLRDRAIAEFADILFPVSVRSDGTMAELMTIFDSKVRRDFLLVAKPLRRQRPDYSKLSLRSDWTDSELVIHFTRSTPIAWPDERAIDYYLAVAASGHDYCRSAAATLDHILAMKRIYASPKHIRSGFRVVGFTSVTADEMKSLFRYRSRLINPNFEPYGIGVIREHATRWGVRPVIYGDDKTYDGLPGDMRPYFQNAGDGKWRAEREWRHVGDFDFADIDRNHLRVIVPSAAEAQRVTAECALPVNYLFDSA